MNGMHKCDKNQYVIFACTGMLFSINPCWPGPERGCKSNQDFKCQRILQKNLAILYLVQVLKMRKMTWYQSDEAVLQCVKQKLMGYLQDGCSWQSSSEGLLLATKQGTMYLLQRGVKACSRDILASSYCCNLEGKDSEAHLNKPNSPWPLTP